MTATSNIIKRRKAEENAGLGLVLQEWCSTIADDIAERRFFDKKEVSAYAKVKLATALEECLKIQSDDLIKKRLEMVKEYTHPLIRPSRKNKLAAEIAELNIKIKDRNKSISAMESYTDKPISNAKKEVKNADFKTDANRYLLGRITEICDEYTHKDYRARNFILSLTFNRGNPNCNESNFVECQLKKDHVSLIDNFSVGDIVYIRYNIKASNFQGNGKRVFVHEIICSGIYKEEQ